MPSNGYIIRSTKSTDLAKDSDYIGEHSGLVRFSGEAVDRGPALVALGITRNLDYVC